MASCESVALLIRRAQHSSCDEAKMIQSVPASRTAPAWYATNSAAKNLPSALDCVLDRLRTLAKVSAACMDPPAGCDDVVVAERMHFVSSIGVAEAMLVVFSFSVSSISDAEAMLMMFPFSVSSMIDAEVILVVFSFECPEHLNPPDCLYVDMQGNDA